MEKKTVLRVKKQDMMELFTCPICNNLYDQATNISECLHTFCRKCIEDKFIVENLRACPVCNLDLGVAPLDKLRLDYTWENLKLKVFKEKPQTLNAATETAKNSQNTPDIPSKISPTPASTSKHYFRRKKKAVLSTVTSPEPLESEGLGGHLQAIFLKQSSSLPVANFEEAKRNETRFEPEHPDKESDQNGVTTLLNIEQESGLAGASTSKGCIQKENNSGKDNEEIPISSDDLGKSLSTTDKEVAPLKRNDTALIVETAITPNGKDNQTTVLNLSEGDTKEVPGDTKEKPVLISSDSDKEEVSGEKQKNNGKEKQENVSTPRKTISGKKGKEKAAYSPPVLRSRRQRNMSSAGTSSEAAISKEAEKKVEGPNKKVWLSLIAATNQNINRPLLPQISSQYIRIDGNAPVSSVKKYLANKIGLKSEDEVEIWLGQEPVCSTLKLQELVDWWVQTTPMAERESAMVGSSGADFVMVLHYSGSDQL